MHPIAERFSQETRAPVVAKFAEGPVYPTGFGALVRYAGHLRCALSLACYAEFGGAIDHPPPQYGTDRLSAPPSSAVAKLVAAHGGGDEMDIRKESIDFFKTVAPDPVAIVAAFGGEAS
jgi:hypothetical protein